MKDFSPLLKRILNAFRGGTCCAATGVPAIALTSPPARSAKPTGLLWRGLLAVFAFAVAAAPSAQAYTLQPLNPAMPYMLTTYRLSGGSVLTTFRRYLGDASATLLGEQNLAAYASTANPVLPLTADAYFIDLPAHNNANAYSDADISALTRLLHSGKPVLAVSFGVSGSTSWAPANAKLAALLGGTLNTSRAGYTTQNVSALHPITEGVVSVQIANAAGIMTPNAGSTGLELTADGGLTLWGEHGNFLVLLGLNAICDVSNYITANSRLANNIAAWLGNDLSNETNGTLVHFNAFGGTPDSFAYLAQGASYVAPTTPTRRGYIFRGWSFTEGGTTPITGPVATAGTHTVWAIWANDPSVWTLQPLSPVTIYDQTVVLPDGIDYSGVRGCFEAQNAVVLNAQSLASYESAPLVADAYFINLAMNGYTPSQSEKNALARVFNSGKPVMFSGEHYGWSAWNNAALNIFGGSNLTWLADRQNTIPNVNNIITKNVQTVMFGGPSGTATPPANAGKWITDGGSVSLWGAQENVLIYLDMNSLASSHNFHGSAPVLFSYNVTFVENIVEWMRSRTSKRVHVSFDSNGGTSDPPSVIVVVGEAYADLPTVTRPDFTFLGWYDDVTGGNLITNGTPIVINDDHTLTARWLGSPVSVFYFENNGTSNYTNIIEAVGGAYNFPTHFTWVGHSLAGWSLTQAGGALLQSPYTITQMNPHGVYAQWTTNLVKVTFSNTAGFLDDYAPRFFLYGTPYGAFPTATHPNPAYAFVGWYTDPVAGVRVSPGDIVSAPGLELALYARWSDALPQLVGSVVISGTTQYGDTLTAIPSVSTPNPGAYTYTWYVGGVAQSGNSATYVVKAADIGKAITVKIESAGTTGSLTSPAVTAAKRLLTWGTSVGANKVYDGNTTATGSVPKLSGVVGSDVVNVGGGTAKFADANVGNGKTITFSGTWTLSGAAASYYTVPSGQPGTTTDRKSTRLNSSH